MKIKDNIIKGASIVLGAYSHLYKRCDDFIEEKTGRGLTQRIVSMEEEDEKLRDEKPILWGLKKLGVGTLKGIFGADL